MVNLAVTNQTPRTIETLEIELRSPVIDASFQWLTPLAFRLRKRTRNDAGYRAYQFPGPCGLQLPYDDVLNHKLVEHGLLRSRHRLEGWLLGIGGLVPTELINGQNLELTLVIVGSDHSEYREKIQVWTELLQTRPKLFRSRSSLFEAAAPGMDLPSSRSRNSS